VSSIAAPTSQREEKKRNEMQSNHEKRAALIARAEEVSKRKPFTQEDTALFNSLMRLSDAMLVEGEPSNTEEQRAVSLRFRELLTGKQIRTYTPLSTGADPQLIAQGFEAQVKSLAIADGPLFAGSPLLTNFYATNMAPSKTVVADDLSSTGFVLVENAGAGADEAEITFSGVTFGKNFFSTGIMLVSMPELDQDISGWTTTETLLAKTTAARLSRIQNATWLAALKTALALNSSASIHAGAANITANNVYGLVSAVGAAYRTSPSAAFIMSPAQQTALGALITAGSNTREFPEILNAKPTLLDYPVHIVAAAAASDILFGDFSFAMSKSMPMEVKTLTERFVLDGYLGVLVGQRADFQWSVPTTSNSPVKMLLFP
jgi:HK97 family phage major capsid protein